MAQAMPAMLPAHEIATIVRSAGFDPISPAMRRGESYVLRATGPRWPGDARHGRCAPRRHHVGDAGRGCRAWRTSRASGWVPTSRLPPHRLLSLPPGVYEAGPPVVYEGDRPVIYERRPLEPIPNAPPRNARAPRTPPIRTLPESSPASCAEERGDHGLLPPPPERFPQRAAPPPAPKPAAKPAPVKRAAAAPPATPPLPKPRPATEAAKSAPAASPPADASSPPEAKPDARSLPH